MGDLCASAVVGLLWTLVSPTLAFAVAAGAMVVAVLSVVLGRTRGEAAAG